MGLLKKMYFYIFILGCLLSGCGAFHDKAVEQASQVQMAKFSTLVAPVLRTNCFSCHSQAGGAAGGRFFMNSSDLDELCRESRKRIVVSKPSESLLYVMATGGNGHGNQLPSDIDRKKIQDWISNPDIETGSDSDSGNKSPSLKFTVGQPVPQNLSTLNYRYVRFSLSDLGHTGAFIEMGVRYFTDGGYEFSQWRVYSPNYPLKITGLNILVSNGTKQELSNTLALVTLTSIQSQVNDSSATPLPSSILSQLGATALVNGAGDVFKLGFTSVTRADVEGAQSSTEQSFFLSKVKPILLNSCASCHGNTNGPNGFNLPNNNDAVLYQNARVKITAKNVTNSLLYQRGTGVGHSPGNKLPNQIDRDSIVSWINMAQ